MLFRKIADLPAGFSSPVLLGSGNFSNVYRAYQNNLDRFVAVKIIKIGNTEIRQKFCEEASLLGRLHLPCIPEIFDVQTSSRTVCIIMEWIKGIPLKNVLYNATLSDSSFRIGIASGFIHSLAQLHLEGIAHRDIKPENIMLTPDDKVYLVDFGFASGPVGHAFNTNTIRGTVKYMAPELWNLECDIDYFKSDLYAMGLILEEILGGPLHDSLKNILNSDPASRPANAGSFLEQWHKYYPVKDSDYDRQKTIKNETSKYLVEKYLDSAQRLYSHGSMEEAYQLVAETLDEDPDCSRAISLLDSMQSSKTEHLRKKRFCSFCSVGIAIILLLFVTYFMGSRINEKYPEISYNKISAVRKFDFLDVKKENQLISNNKNTFINFDKGSLACGRLTCLAPSGAGMLIAGKDTILLGNYSDREITLTLKQGLHTIQWVDSLEDITISETVSVLPFENKQIKLKKTF